MAKNEASPPEGADGSASAKSDDADLPPLAEVVERIGFGWAHARATLIGGGVWAADGAELLLIGTVTRSVSKEWDLSAMERGLVVTVVFVGICMGNFTSGPLGDTWGRRIPVIISYIGVFVFSLLSSITQNIGQLIIIRLLVGASFGIGQPAYGALCTEITPVYWRICMCGCAQLMFTAGEVYSAMLIFYDDPTMKNLDWRWLLAMGAVPSFFLGILAYLFLRQSPSYLALIGQPKEATKILEAIAKDNGRFEGQKFDFKPAPPVVNSGAGQALSRQLGTVFNRHMLYSTLTMTFTCFELNMIFYGCLYAFPQVVQDVDMGVVPAQALLEGALWEIPGYLLGIIAGMYLNRKPTIMLYLFLITASLLAFTVGATSKGNDWYLHYCLHGGYIGIKMFACIGFISVYQYATEIYPTVARTTGTAMCISGGRVGGMTAPLLFEGLQEHTGGFGAFFNTIAVLALINLALISMMPHVDVANLQERLIDDLDSKP